jgi:curved DNA-binding protein CbpA
LHSSLNNGETTTNPSNDTKSSTKRRIDKPKKDLYAILGATPSMSKSEIKRLYITLAKQTHPDSPSYDPNNTEFSEIASAYKILMDDKLKRRYDRELAAEEFKGDVVAYASEIAKEYGPVARKLYDEWALPFLKRTTASTVAGLSVISEVASESNNNNSNNGVVERTRIMGSNQRMGTPLQNGATLSEVVSEMTQMERERNGSNSNRALEDFGKAFQRVIEAGRNATRQIDGAELEEKSVELRAR